MVVELSIPQKEKTYDDLFKEILETFPSHRVIAFLNSVFKRKMSLESVIEPLRTEFNAKSRLIADYFLKVTEPDGTAHYFHLEAQTGNDNRMVLRMVEYGVRFALQHTQGDIKDNIIIELPHAVVFYLRDNKNTPRTLNVTIKTPDGQELNYTIPTERMSDYTPEMLLEQDKFPLFPFYMLNFEGKDAERFEQEWLAGCVKLNELVKDGRMDNSDAKRLLEDGLIVMEKVNFPNRKEVMEKMTISMFDSVGVGIDWIELKRQTNELIAQAEARAEARARAEAEARAKEKSIVVAKRALTKGLSLEDAAELADLSVDEIRELAKS